MTGLAESPPRADVRIRSLRAAPHELRIIVTCPSQTTVLERATPPGDLPARVAEFVTVAAFRHAAHCGARDLADVHRKGARWVYGATSGRSPIGIADPA